MLGYLEEVRPPIEPTGPIDPKAIESIDFVIEHDALPSSGHLQTICKVLAHAAGVVVTRNGEHLDPTNATFNGEVVIEHAAAEIISTNEGQTIARSLRLIVRDVVSGDRMRAEYGANGLRLSEPSAANSQSLQ